MGDLAIVTPTFGPDAEIFSDLRRSIVEYAAESTHHVVIPPADLNRFEKHECDRCTVRTYLEFLSGRYLPLPVPGYWVHRRRPWPPVRGWVLQQAMKVAAVGALDTRAALVVDSDVVLVRPVDTSDLTQDGAAKMYRVDDAVHEGMERHLRWHRVARKMLGVDRPVVPPTHDYVSAFNVWDPVIVRGMQRRITEVTGRHWLDAITSELHVSEFVLYGVYVDEVLGGGPIGGYVGRGFCHTHWDTTPLDRPAAEQFAARIGMEALAVMISAKSRTPRDVRSYAEQLCRERVAAEGTGR